MTDNLLFCVKKAAVKRHILQLLKKADVWEQRRLYQQHLARRRQQAAEDAAYRQQIMREELGLPEDFRGNVVGQVHNGRYIPGTARVSVADPRYAQFPAGSTYQSTRVQPAPGTPEPSTPYMPAENTQSLSSMISEPKPSFVPAVPSQPAPRVLPRRSAAPQALTRTQQQAIRQSGMQFPQTDSLEAGRQVADRARRIHQMQMGNRVPQFTRQDLRNRAAEYLRLKENNIDAPISYMYNPETGDILGATYRQADMPDEAWQQEKQRLRSNPNRYVPDYHPMWNKPSVLVQPGQTAARPQAEFSIVRQPGRPQTPYAGQSRSVLRRPGMPEPNVRPQRQVPTIILPQPGDRSIVNPSANQMANAKQQAKGLMGRLTTPKTPKLSVKAPERSGTAFLPKPGMLYPQRAY